MSRSGSDSMASKLHAIPVGDIVAVSQTMNSVPIRWDFVLATIVRQLTAEMSIP